MKNLVKIQHGAGGFQFYLSEHKGNTGLGKVKQKAIIEALQDSWTEGVYQTTSGKIKRQLLNGNAEFLTLDRKLGIYYFS